jgi:hypothetical protein
LAGCTLISERLVAGTATNYLAESSYDTHVIVQQEMDILMASG